MNKEGYNDPTAEKVIANSGRGEIIAGLEKKYGIRCGDKVKLKFTKLVFNLAGKRTQVYIREMKVVNLYPRFILLRDVSGYHETFLWDEFLRRMQREGKR